MSILIVKKEHSEEDERDMAEHLGSVRKEWAADWGERERPTR